MRNGHSEHTEHSLLDTNVDGDNATKRDDEIYRLKPDPVVIT